MKRVAFFGYSLVTYLLFLAVYAYMAGFIGNFLVPKTIDAPVGAPWPQALVANLALVGLFAVQHSVMARPGFKKFWTKFVPQPIERTTYVLIANFVVILLMWQWQPIDAVVWSVSSGPLYYTLLAVFAIGWFMVPAVSLMINHFDLFGLRQTWLNLRGRPDTPLAFRTPMLYAHVRHPLYIGWALLFWATPTMTVGHLLFAGTLTLYMVLASKVEERDLVGHFGHLYEEYRRRVPAFVPRLRPSTVEVESRTSPEPSRV